MVPPLAEQVAEELSEFVGELKPRLRGWLHAVATPMALALGLLLVVRAPEGPARTGAAVFALSALAMFGVSATLHRGRWSPRANLIVTRLDHACIFLLIAGSYTPFAMQLLDGGARTALLTVAWGGAALGIAFRVLWTTAPRWVYTPVYLGLGWAAIFFVDDFAHRTSVGVLALMALGGVLYTVGAVVYGLKRPNPVPQWFGFHEVFHAFTVLAFASHYLAVTAAVTG